MLPVIDVSALYTSDPARRAELADQVRAACFDKGFFYIRGHTVPAALTAAVFAHAEALFARPEAEKLALDKARSPANRGYEPLRGQTLEAGAPPDLKEGFYIGPELAPGDPANGRFNQGANQWPDGDAGFRATMTAYHAALAELSTRLMGALALSLDLPEDWFDAFCRDPIAILRLLHYPPQPARAAEGEKGAGAHTDFGGLTLLAQDDNGGLEVMDRETGAWIVAPPIPGTLVVNLGDLIARWTNDRYRSTLHRVVNRSGRERYSVPFFFSGAADHAVVCLPTCLAPGETPLYPPITVEAHLEAMYRRTYSTS